MDSIAQEIEELESLENEMDLEGGLGRMNRAQRRRLRFLKARYKQRMQGYDWPLWDSVEIATSATTELQFFQEPIGQSSKTKIDTSMSAAGLITVGDYWDCHAIGIRLKDSAATPIPAAEFREILYAGYFELSISDRLVYSALLDDLPYGGGPTGVAGSGAAAIETEFASNGAPTYQSMHWLKKKIRIPRNTHFIAKAFWPTAPTPTTAIKMVVRMQGVLWRRRV